MFNHKKPLQLITLTALLSTSYLTYAEDHDHEHEHEHQHEEGHRHHEAHVHGVVQLNIAQDEDHVLFEIKAPGADIVGFEHPPTNAEEENMLTQAVEKLNQPNSFFTLSDEANCSLEEHQVSHTLKKEEDHHDEHNDHDHADEHDEGSQHGEFIAEYSYHCDDISKLTSIDTQWFTLFTHSKEIVVQYLGDSGQKAASFTPDATTFNL